MNVLKLEVIPIKCTGRNLHSHDIISKERWGDISQRIRSNGRCKFCHKIFVSEDLHAHEVWEFDLDKKIQRLKEIICVCEKCHLTIHYHNLLSNQKLEDRDAFIYKAHYMDVNKCYEKDFEKDLNSLLYTYRMMNQITDDWSMDISYAIKAGLLSYDDINIENLEKTAPGSAFFLELYKSKIKIHFNNIPTESLIDLAKQRHRSIETEVCEICGKKQSYLYQFYDLRIKINSSEMMLVGTKQICKLCRKTIYQGAHRTFLRFRKTTRHYMKLNDSTYKECVQAAKDARNIQKIGRKNFYIYLNTPPLPTYEFKMRNKYLYGHGARFNQRVNRWCLMPVRNLKDFMKYL